MSRPAITLVLATQNPGKLAELRALVHGLPVAVAGIKDIVPDYQAPAATGATFEENAIIKARAVAQATPLGALADESGLAVDALGGRPGGGPAGFARGGAAVAENNAALLMALDEVDDAARTARFRCVVALCDPFAAEANRVELFSGACEGSVARSARGESGFGYDPLFVLQGRTQTFAELAGEEKASVSHRGMAMRKLVPRLASLIEARIAESSVILERAR